MHYTRKRTEHTDIIYRCPRVRRTYIQKVYRVFFHKTQYNIILIQTDLTTY